MYSNGPSLIGILYFVIGVIMAATRGYLQGLGSLDSILSALLAILLWPALLVGADLHITLFGA